MRRFAGVSIACAIGLAAVFAPILLSVHLARQQSLDGEMTRLRGYANDVLRRADTTADQQLQATITLEKAHLPPCSPQEVDLMREIAVTSDYLQVVGRVSGDQLICSSLGAGQPMPLGPVSFFAKAGTGIRTGVRLPFAGNQPLLVGQSGSFASIISPSLPIDVATEGPDVSIALFLSSSGRLITASGPVRPSWLTAGRSASRAQFTDRNFIVVVVRSTHTDLAAVAAAPRSAVDRRVRAFTLYFVPIGMLCGLVLAAAVFYLSRSRLSMPGILRAAARHNEFFVDYQPVIDLASRRCVGAEALVRWRRNGEVIRAESFIQVAEETGIVTLITERVLSIVAADLPALLRRDPGFRVGINLSAPDLESPATLPQLERLLHLSGASAANIVIEITERGFLQGPPAQDIVRSIGDQGFDIAIDDFGTGYSSLSRLATLRLNFLKIDKSFVNPIGTGGVTSQVVLHIIEMAHSLGLEIVAEGVETEEQARFLQERGVRLAQGWLFARAMPLSALLTLIDSAAPISPPATELTANR